MNSEITPIGQKGPCVIRFLARVLGDRSTGFLDLRSGEAEQGWSAERRSGVAWPKLWTTSLPRFAPILLPIIEYDPSESRQRQNNSDD